MDQSKALSQEGEIYSKGGEMTSGRNKGGIMVLGGGQAVIG